MLRTNYPDPGRSRDVEAVKRRAYHDQDTLVVRLDHPMLTWDQREMLRQVANKLYGEKGVSVLRTA